MALDGNRLGTAIANAIQASIPPANQKITSGQLEAMWQAVANEIVTEFQTNAEVGNLPPGSYQDAESRPITGTSGTLQGAIS